MDEKRLFEIMSEATYDVWETMRHAQSKGYHLGQMHSDVMSTIWQIATKIVEECNSEKEIS